MSAYKTNENGTTWVVQQVVFDEFERGQLENPTLSDMASFDNYGDAHRFFNSYCSGLNDDEGACSNQNFSYGYFYRIVEMHPGFDC